MISFIKRAIRGLIVLALAVLPAAAAPHLMLTTKHGVVDIALLPELAPQHVERIVTLANMGFYDGVKFHRVIEGFMAQTGDPTGTGAGGSDFPDVAAEFNAESFQRGVVGAARSSDPNSFNSQFFICFGDASFLDGQYTVFGKVAAGMEIVDLIQKGDPQSGAMENPDVIISAKIEEK